MILITRPLDDSKRLADILERQNFECLVEPMIKIDFIQPDWENHFNSTIQSFIATSKNGKKFAPSGFPLASIPDQGRNSAQLLLWILANLNPNNGKLVYLRGDVISFDLASELTRSGFTVEEIITYKSVPVDDLSESFIDNFDKIDLALFFSAKSMKNFLALAKKHNLKLKNLRVLALSQEILDKAASKVKFAETFVADQPNLNAMIEKINEVY